MQEEHGADGHPLIAEGGGPHQCVQRQRREIHGGHRHRLGAAKVAHHCSEPPDIVLAANINHVRPTDSLAALAKSVGSARYKSPNINEATQARVDAS